VRSENGSPLLHPLNVLLVLALASSSAVTGSVAPLAIAAVTEVLWMALARTLESQRRYFGYARLVADPERELIRTLTDEDRRRHVELTRLAGDIREIASSTSVSKDMLSEELPKVDHLLAAFARVASNAARLEDFGRTTDLDRLEEEVRRQEKVVEKTKDPGARSVAAQNLELMQRRLERAAEIRRRSKEARGQLSLIENTVRLLRDQIATIESTDEIRGRLDDLVRNVDVIEASTRETEALGARPALSEKA
jgi:hypothetical protein